MATKLDRARADYWATRTRSIAACRACHHVGDAELARLRPEVDRALDAWAETEARYDEELRLAVERSERTPIVPRGR